MADGAYRFTTDRAILNGTDVVGTLLAGMVIIRTHLRQIRIPTDRTGLRCVNQHAIRADK